jgi:hypothetical protein
MKVCSKCGEPLNRRFAAIRYYFPSLKRPAQFYRRCEILKDIRGLNMNTPKVTLNLKKFEEQKGVVRANIADLMMVLNGAHELSADLLTSLTITELPKAAAQLQKLAKIIESLKKLQIPLIKQGIDNCIEEREKLIIEKDGNHG